MSILIILVSEADTWGSNWAFQLNGFAHAYYLFKDKGVEVTLASLEGGWPWPGLAARYSEVTDSFARFAKDSSAREELADTLCLDQVCVDDFVGAYCVGLPGPIWRSAKEVSVAAVLARFLSCGKPVAVIPSHLDIVPRGAGNGLLITGEAGPSALLAAQSLLAATQARAVNQ